MKSKAVADTMPLQDRIRQMFSRELAAHGRAFANYERLRSLMTRTFDIEGIQAQVFYNPARAQSILAKVDAESLRQRQCFLCPEGLEEQQLTVEWQSPYRTDAAGTYCIRVNPFPIFPEHYTLSSALHERQQILPHYADMLALATDLPDYTLFYNGPHCGASAPDHMHFQAVPRGSLPLQVMCDQGKHLQILYQSGTTAVFRLTAFATAARLLRSSNREEMIRLFNLVYTHTPLHADEEWEPRMNIVGWYNQATQQFNTLIFLRQESRPACFFASERERILLSPASVEMSGVAVVPDEDSFRKLTAEQLRAVIQEVSLPNTQTQHMDHILHSPQHPLSVGICSAPSIQFRLNGRFLCQQNGQQVSGEQQVSLHEEGIVFDGQTFSELLFTPAYSNEAAPSFTLHDVTIGIQFHWERKEDQTFGGSLKIIIEEGHLTAVNLIGTEDYLESVISSEMSATSHIELLKAHAVISRSWVLRPIFNPAAEALKAMPEDSAERHIRWYERDAHKHFDVCADDHCQRYQGITRQTSQAAHEAVEATWGEVLTYAGNICDARFYKACGGATEHFSHCWAEEEHPYLRPIRDNAGESLPDLTQEAEAEQWIRSAPASFCNTNDRHILSQVLNQYDQETADFYRWTVRYTRQELSALIRKRSGIDFGEIVALVPKKRGASARIYELEIVGTKRRMTIGKELEIRKWLSASHLYSSAFVVDTETDAAGTPVAFSLIGAGWGHGVGLCQIGAAVMAEKGYTYRQILAHYFPDSTLQQVSQLSH